MRYSIVRNAGKAGVITTEDLIDAASGMKAHLDLMERAQHTGSDVLTLDDVLIDTVRVAVEGMKGTNDRLGDITFEVDDEK